MDNINLFEEEKGRSHWDEKAETWCFSVVHTIEILTGTDSPRKYWGELEVKTGKCVVAGENFLHCKRKCLHRIVTKISR